MIYVYVANVKSLSAKCEADMMEYNRLVNSLCEERRAKVNALKQPADRIRSLAAGLLLQSSLQEYLFYSVGQKDCGHRHETKMHMVSEIDEEVIRNAERMKKLKIEYGQHEKPYLPDYPGIFFNLSHSGDYVTVAVSCHPVGIDVQEKRTISDALKGKFFAEKERTAKTPGYYIFSGKESYVKLTGEGMSRSFQDFSVDFAKKQVFCVNTGEVLAYLRYKEIEDGAYIVCVCDKCRDIISW